MELYIQPIKRQRNAVNGQFLTGSTPFNKGKKWTDYMDMRKARRIKKNLELGRKGNPNIGGQNKREVVGIKDGKIYGVFESSTEAGKKLGLCSRNIRHCCEGKRAKCGGVHWFHTSNIDSWKKLLK